MRCAGARQSLVIGICHKDLAEDSDFGHRNVGIKSAWVTAVRFPGLPVKINMLAHCRSGAKADEIVAVPGRILHAFGIVRRVPQRWVGALEWLKFHR
jgi:hypothetical protein